MANNEIWEAIVKKTGLSKHNFSTGPFYVTHTEIKKITSTINAPNNRKEIRILGYQATREQRPQYFIDNNLFLLPASNKGWVVIKGEGYIDIPEINTAPVEVKSKLDFEIESFSVGISEMQYLDFAFVHGITQQFLEDESIELTVRGRKRTPGEFIFNVNNFKITQGSVQTEVDGGYEGQQNIYLVEAKNAKQKEVIIRQLYFPYRYWSSEITNKKVHPVFLKNRVMNLCSGCMK